MHKKRIYSFFIFIIVLMQYSCTQIAPAPKVQNGEIDLSKYDLKTEKLIALDGEWDFYWDQLLTPEDFKFTSSIINQKKTFIVPNIWNSYKIRNHKIGSHGYATYRLKINTNDIGSHYALRINRLETAYKLWVNDSLMIQVGKLGMSKKKSIPKWLPTEIFFEIDTNVLDITIQISNFHHTKGGFSHRIFLGTPESVHLKSKQKVGFDTFLFGLLLIISLYHFGLYILRRKDKSTLFFGILSLSVAGHLFSSSELLIMQIFPNLSWRVLVSFTFISNYIRISALGLFFYKIFEEYFDRRLAFVIGAWAILFSFLSAVTTVNFFSSLLIYSHIFTGLLIIYIIYVLIKASFDGYNTGKRNSAIISLVAFFFLALTMLNDILYDRMIIQTTFLVPLGVFVFILFQSFMLSLSFSSALNSV